MKARVREGEVEPEKLNLAATEDLEAHIQSLTELARVANRAMSTFLVFELRIRSSIREIEVASQNAAVTDLHGTSGLLTVSEAARKLGVTVRALRNNRGGRYPAPLRHRGTSLLYELGELEQWLSERP